MDEHKVQISPPERVCARIADIAGVSQLSSLATVALATCDGVWPRPAHVGETRIRRDFTSLLQGISAKLASFAFWNMTNFRTELVGCQMQRFLGR